MEFNKLLSLVLGFVILILAFVWISNRFRASQAEKQGENPTTVVSQTSPSQTQTTTTTTPSAQGSSITPSATPKEESNSRNPLAFLFNRNDKNESDKQSSKEAPLSNEDSSQTNNTTATIKTGQTNNGNTQTTNTSGGDKDSNYVSTSTTQGQSSETQGQSEVKEIPETGAGTTTMLTLLLSPVLGVYIKKRFQ